MRLGVVIPLITGERNARNRRRIPHCERSGSIRYIIIVGRQPGGGNRIRSCRADGPVRVEDEFSAQNRSVFPADESVVRNGILRRLPETDG